MSQTISSVNNVSMNDIKFRVVEDEPLMKRELTLTIVILSGKFYAIFTASVY